MLTVPSIAAPSFVAAQVEALADWTITLHIVETWTENGFDERLEATYIDGDLESASLTWEASREGHARFTASCGEGFNGYDISGSGSGIGSFIEVLGFPNEWGLPAGTYTTLVPNAEGSFTTSTISYACPGIPADPSPGAEGPVQGPLFLPGTVEELAALPTGTTLSDTYTRHVDGGTTHATVTTSIDYTAVKGPSEPQLLQVDASFAFTGSLGLLNGGDVVDLSGEGLSQVSLVCFRSLWEANLVGSRDSAGVLWNGAVAAGLELTTAVEQDSVDEVRNAFTGRGKKAGVRQTIVMSYCVAPTATSAGARATYPWQLSVAALSGTIKKIRHDLAIEVYGAGDRLLASFALDDKSTKGKLLRVSWSEDARRTVLVD